MVTATQIEQFLAQPDFAVVGVSRNPKQFGYIVYKKLKENGLKVIPVNPNATEIMGDVCYPDIKSLPQPPAAVIVLTPAKFTDSIVNETVSAGIKHLWIQQTSQTPAALEMAEKNNIDVISKQCILKFARPDGIHKFHRNINKLFGLLPK